jgi:hypothetical protein
MSSVRTTAAGAVVVAFLGFLSTPVSACDERYVKRCEKLSAAEAAAAQAQAATPAAKRKSGRRVQMVFSVRSKHGRVVKRTRAPGFAAKPERRMVLASDSMRMTALVPESALARRFRGFIDPLPMAQNAFETLRKPHLVALNLDATPAMPVGEPAAAPLATAKSDTPEEVAVASAAPMAKQDKVIAKPAAPVEPAAIKPIALAEAFAAKPVAVVEAGVSAPIVPQAKPQAILTEAPPPVPADEQPSRFSVHQLVLALCGALGAASALRFIVGA